MSKENPAFIAGFFFDPFSVPVSVSVPDPIRLDGRFIRARNRCGSAAHEPFATIEMMAGARFSSKQLIAVLVALLGALVAFVLLRSSAEPTNVVLICVDTLRSDHLSGYGYHRSTTPNLDAFAQAGMLFTHARAESPWTLPSHATLFTSLMPTQHGAIYQTSRLGPQFETLAEQVWVVQITGADAVVGVFVGIDGADAPAGGAHCLAIPSLPLPSILLGAIQQAVVGPDQVGADVDP